MNRNIPSRGGIPGAGWASVRTQKADAGVGAVPRCAWFESLDGAHEERESEMFAF